MKPYQVDISRRVRQQVEGLPGHIRQRVKREIAQLAFNPRPEYAAELRGNLAGRYKIRLDPYRLVYRIDDEMAVAEALKAGKKHDAFYDDLD
jgi:mRNA-degrading endonuclease RelE of RelBE toxin-antitoxin system